MIKRGDERLAGFSAMLDKLNSTPLGELERQVKHRYVIILAISIAILAHITCTET